MHGHFIPTTPNARAQFANNVNISTNLQQSFTPNRPLIDTPDFVNKGQVLHNNLAEKLLAERVVEYRIQISSADRDIKCFPNIFDIKTSFGNSNYCPNIKRPFKNIRYITLNSVIMPRTIAIDTSHVCTTEHEKCCPDNFNIYPTSSAIKCPPPCPPSNPLHNLECHPYLILKIKELKTENNMASNSLLDGDGFMLIPDQKLGDMYLWKPRRTTVVYPNSLLSNLCNLSLLLTDERGKKLTLYDQCGKDIICHPIKNCHTDDYDCENYPFYVERFKCKNEMVEYTDTVTQVIYDFTFGVIENELNTLTNFPG